MSVQTFKNPFRPGAGQNPPYLAGREEEKEAFSKLLEQEVVMKNLILTGLRGTGKTVLLETFKPVAFEKKWNWVGSDLSESACVSEVSIATRILTDLSIVTSNIIIGREKPLGFVSDNDGEDIRLSYGYLISYFSNQPGLVSDKLKSTLEFVWNLASKQLQSKGVVFAYDEAQNMTDRAKDKEYPLSVLLDVFQSLQRKGVPYLLVLTGLPTLFPKLVETRTYSERMFSILELNSLSENECRDAIIKPIEDDNCPVSFNEASVHLITTTSGGYPYFIQFLCREAFDSFLNQAQRNIPQPSVPIAEILAKLDGEFFSGRWNNISDRQRELLSVVAALPNCQSEFTIQEVVEMGNTILKSPISGSQANQMFSKLTDVGLIYKTRHGKYTLGIPLLSEFIKRQQVPLT